MSRSSHSGADCVGRTGARGGFDRIRVEDGGRKVRKEYFGTQQSDPELEGPSAPDSHFTHKDIKAKRAWIRATWIRVTIGILP